VAGSKVCRIIGPMNDAAKNDHRAHVSAWAPLAQPAGLRYVRHSPALVSTLVRCACVVAPASCLTALLPHYARVDLGLSSFAFGGLLGCMGVGALLAAWLLSPGYGMFLFFGGDRESSSMTAWWSYLGAMSLLGATALGFVYRRVATLRE
jgi:hypothetical protein